MRRFILFICYLGLQLPLTAQTVFESPQKPSFSPQAPNTAVLERFGEYPVSLFSGVPTISIPLYTIKTASFEVPITLDYHASGIKVHDYPSWVGAGWALNTGGSIRRQMQGLPDESLAGFKNDAPRKANDLAPFSGATMEDDYYYLSMLNKKHKDFAADIFSFNYPGGGGKFFLDETNSYQPQQIPYSPNKIGYTLNSYSFSQFAVNDPAGNYYQFGGSSIEIGSFRGGMDAPAFYDAAWMLEKMVSASKRDTIFFKYQGQSELHPFERNDVLVVDDLVNNLTQPDECTNFATPYSFSEGNLVSMGSMSQIRTNSLNNQEIIFANGKVVFEMDTQNRLDFNSISPNNKALKYIKVYSRALTGGYTLLKTITFNYSYFGSGASARLKLNSIKTTDNTTSQESSYSFAYNSLELPDPGMSVQKDLWGYYNGQTNNLLIPQATISYKPLFGNPYTTNITIGSSNSVGREPNAYYMQAAMLQRINYPAGGYTDFEFEPNKYLDGVTEKLAGGLRVKTIKSYDAPGATPIIKSYKYGLAESGVGRANFYAPNHLYFDEQNYEKWYVSIDCAQNPDFPHNEGAQMLGATKRSRSYYSNPTVGLTGADGIPVTYAYVTEYNGEGTNVLGKTTYQYTDTPDDIDIIGTTSTSFVISHAHERGQLLQKNVYAKEGSLFKKREETINTYNTTAFPWRNKFAGLLLRQQVVKENLRDMGGYGYPDPDVISSNDWSYSSVYYASEDNYLTSSLQKIYNPEDDTKFQSSLTEYTYTNEMHQQPTTITYTNSKSEVFKVKSKFPADYLSSGTTGNTVLDALIAKNAQAAVVEKWQTVTRSGVDYVTGAFATNYSILTGDLVAIDNQKKLKVSTPFAGFTPSVISSGALQLHNDYELSHSINVYDKRGNPAEVQKTDDVKEVYVWGYKGQYPVAHIVGSDWNTVKTYIDTALLNNGTQAQVTTQLANLRTAFAASALVQVTTFTFEPLIGMIKQVAPNGLAMSYEYDGLGRLSYIKDHDGKILKKLCYNYKGESQVCSENPTPDWQNTATALRCKKDGSNQNTGEQEQEQKDTNPYSPTYNQTRWVVSGTNTTACPVLPSCHGGNCYGDDKKCVNGTCETGVRVNVGSDFDMNTMTWICYYRYEFSDNTWSETFWEYSGGSCYFGF